jgi:cellulose biosynthesis protein BcsQ
MGKVIIFGNQKGGVGKSTCTLLAANAFASEPFNLKVKVIDLDEQQTIGVLYEGELERGTEPIWELISYPESITGGKIHKFLKIFNKAMEESDVLFVDLPGYLDEGGKTDTVSPMADFIFIPFTPSDKDTYSTETYLLAMLEKKKQVFEEQERELGVIPFVNKIDTRIKSQIGYVKNILSSIESLHEIDGMKNMLGLYKDHANAGIDTNMYGGRREMKEKNLTKWINELHQMINS